MKIGSQPVRLGDTGVLILSTAFRHGDHRARWVSYADVVTVAVTEGHGLRRGALTIGQTKGERIEVRYSAHQQAAMLALCSELWRRVKDQRVEQGDAPGGSTG